ncbi:MAG: hypothetical protein KAI66_01635 [Lentisphaeria bacterium]|nr:hypothetical protein [Lentisphaeria bacterium]
MGEALRVTGIVFGCILFYLTMFLGVVIIPVGFPGQFLVAAAVLVFTLASTRKHDASRTVAKGALIGRIVGTVVKVGCAMAMIALTTATLVVHAFK